MMGTWLRRTIAAAALASLAMLAACGSGSIESALQPARIVSFGDGMSDLGNRARYTVNDGTTNVWVQQFAASYRLTLTSSSAGGLGYAWGNARINSKPDAAGNAATPTLVEQVDAFLAANTVGQNDVYVLNAGLSDIVAETAAVQAGTRSEAQMLANLQQAGRDLGAQARRLVQAGAKYVVVVGPYNLGRSPWATSINKVALLTDATNKLNEAMLVSVVDLGANVLYVDAAYYFNLVTAFWGSYGFNDATTVACTSVDPANGIGIGTNQVNSALCTPSTIGAGLDYNKYEFADRIYFTPELNRLFGIYAFDRIRARW